MKKLTALLLALLLTLSVCAVFAAARQAGLCGDRAAVRLPGGVLALERRGGSVWMAGPARTVFEGELEDGPSGG